MDNKPTNCESCNSITLETKTLEDGAEVVTNTIQRMETFGRPMFLCKECVKKETEVSLANAKDITPFRETITGKIEHIVELELKSVNTIDRWQDLYNTERKAWLVENFESLSDMRAALSEFIKSLECLQFDSKAKMRAAKDSARELDARLSKSERDKLINDPNFKAADNSEFKKKIKTTRESKEDKALKALMSLGISEADARKSLGQI